MKIIVTFTLLLLSSTAFAKKMSFEQAYKKIIELDPTIQSQKKLYKSAKANRLSRYGTFLPAVNVSWKKQRELEHDQSVESKNIDASMNLFKFGRDLNLAIGSDQQLSAQKKMYLQTKLDAEDFAISLLLNFLYEQNQINLSKKQKSLSEDSLKLARVRFSRGLISKSDLDKFELQNINAESEYQDDLSRYNESLHKILSILGNESKIEDRWPWGPNEVRELIERKKGDITKKNISLQAARLLVKEAKSNLLASKLDFTPSVDLSYSHQLDGIKERSVLLSVSFPIFSRFDSYAQLSKQAYNYESSRKDLIHKEREISTRYHVVMKNLQRSIPEYQRRGKGLKLSKSVYEKSLKRFQNGKLSANDLLDEQRRLLQTQKLFLSSNHSLHKQILEYCQIEGQFIVNCLRLKRSKNR